MSNIFKHMLPDVSEAGLPELTVELRGPYASSEHAFPRGYLLQLTDAHSAGSSLQDTHTLQVLRHLCKSLKCEACKSHHIQVMSSFSLLTSLHISASRSLMLSDCLTSLASLQNLQELVAIRFTDFPTQLSSLTALTKLSIEPSSISVHDFSAYSQLQYLLIGPSAGTLRTPLFLPFGPTVALQTLKAASDCILHDLASATGLTHLEVQDSHFEGPQWPTNLIKLQVMRIHQPDEVIGETGIGFQGMPPQWQHYTSLQNLSLGPYEPCDSGQMPEWFSSLGKLTRLDLAGVAVLDFRACWTCFSQLQHLDLRCYDSMIHRDVVILARTPQLTYLSFADLRVRTDGITLGKIPAMSVSRI